MGWDVLARIRMLKLFLGHLKPFPIGHPSMALVLMDLSTMSIMLRTIRFKNLELERWLILRRKLVLLSKVNSFDLVFK